MVTQWDWQFDIALCEAQFDELILPNMKVKEFSKRKKESERPDTQSANIPFMPISYLLMKIEIRETCEEDGFCSYVF